MYKIKRNIHKRTNERTNEQNRLSNESNKNALAKTNNKQTNNMHT